jgi:hypothetical protein
MDPAAVPPTPPPTQAPLQHSGQGMSSKSPNHHPEFYYTDPMLTDPIILQVRHCLAHQCCIVVTPVQAENTLYRLSFFYLAQGSHFFSSAFSIRNEKDDSQGGRSDELPIVLPSTITCAAFDVYLHLDKK